MYLGDTHIIGHYSDRHPILLLHLQRVKWDEICLPTPAVAEVLRGRAEFALKAGLEKIVWAHAQFLQTHRLMTKFRLLLLNENAKEIFERLLKKFKSKKTLRRHDDRSNGFGGKSHRGHAQHETFCRSSAAHSTRQLD